MAIDAEGQEYTLHVQFEHCDTIEARKQFIRHKLETDDAWLYRGLLAIYAGQTASEQLDKVTAERNNIGFNGTDAAFLSDLAERVKKYGSLRTEKQVAACRRAMLKYAGQFERIAKAGGR